jgi:cytochrome c peroxidase
VRSVSSLAKFGVVWLFTSLLIAKIASTQTPTAPRREPITPIPDSIPHDPKKAALGKLVFFDKRASFNDSLSCFGCHLADRGGADGLSRSLSAAGKPTPVNTPTIFNVAFNFRQTWNGRASSLADQADKHFTVGALQGLKWPELLTKLAQDASLKRAFEEVYPGTGFSKEAITDAIEHYERTLLTPNSRFDRYLKGDDNAITKRELQGYSLFKSYGCVACHQGVNIGGNMFQKFGAMGDYFKDKGKIEDADYGRFNATKEEADRFVFKVPSLRNVAQTAPYFHDGSAKTLDAAVDVMFKYQLGREAPANDKAAIVDFLKTLTGDIPAHYKP